MKDIALYVEGFSEAGQILAEKWLRERRSHFKNVFLLYRQEDLAPIQDLAKKYSLDNVLPVEQTESTTAALKGIDEVIMTSFFAPNELRFSNPGAMIPSFRGRYELFNSLWRLGLRSFNLFSMYGDRKVEIPFMLEHFHKKHEGQRCFILGNGPSLNGVELDKLQDEITFACNRIFLGFEDWKFRPTYWGFGDRLQVERYYYEYEDGVPDEIVKFFPFEYAPLLNMKNTCPIPFDFGMDNFPQFANDPLNIYMGHSMVYILLQLAYLMGFSEIVLLGVDHTYNLKKEVFKGDFWKHDDVTGSTHFKDNYTKDEARVFIPPRTHYAEEAYFHAAKVLSERGVKVLNASEGTGLKAFETASVKDLI